MIKRLSELCIWATVLLVTASFSFNSVNAQVAPQQSSKEVAADIEKSARKLFKKAEDNYKNDNFWQAAVDLILILDFYPEYSELEKVVFLLSTCLFDLEMYDGAEQMYRYLLRSVTKTKLVAESILGLQKVAYLKADYQQSLKFYKAIESHYTQHETIQEARYYAGQTYFNMESYNLVQNLIPHISKKSEFYPFAIYTAGLTHLKKKMFVRLWPSSGKLQVCRQKTLSESRLSMLHA